MYYRGAAAAIIVYDIQSQSSFARAKKRVKTEAAASGGGARYAVLLDDTATVANREVWFVWDLQGERNVSVGQALTLRDLTMRGTAVS